MIFETFMSCGPPLSGALTQPEDIAADLVEDGGRSWTKPTASGPLWPWIEESGSRGERPLPSSGMMQASSISIIKKKVKKNKI